MKTSAEEEYEAVIQRISETVGAPFPSNTEAVVKAVTRKMDAEWNAAIEAAAQLLLSEAEAIKTEMADPDIHINSWNMLSLSHAVREGSAQRIRALKREAK